MPTPTTIAIAATSLASLPHDALIELYNAESRRLSHGVEPHLVDSSCKPGYIVRLFGTLAIRARQAAEQRSNELARIASESAVEVEDDALLAVPLNVAKPFSMMR